MKRGRPRKENPDPVEPIVERHPEAKESFVEDTVSGQQVPVVDRVEELRAAVNKPEPAYDDYIKESRKALDAPLAPGMKFFESPDGEIIVGEESRNEIWSRRMNNGKGGWINPRR